MTLRGGTVRAYLQGLREIGAVTGSTDHTLKWREFSGPIAKE